MSVGSFRLPIGSASPTPPSENIVEFTASGTYTKPVGLVELVVFAQAPGGGGGAGRSTSTGGTAGGGGYGGSGAFVVARIPAASIAATEAVTIGAPGSGGTGGINTNGGNGTAGGDVSFGSLVLAKGGGFGRGGNNPTPQSSGASALDCVPIGGSWSRNGYSPRAGTTVTVPGLVGSIGSAAAGTGGNGGLRVTTGTPEVGGDGGGVYQAQALVAGGAGATTDGANGSNGSNNVKLDYMANFTDLVPTIGHGTAGGGGAYGLTTTGGNGGAGGYGTGGAGGGGALSAFAGGAGANGGGGFLVVLEIIA